MPYFKSSISEVVALRLGFRYRLNIRLLFISDSGRQSIFGGLMQILYSRDNNLVMNERGSTTFHGGLSLG